MVGLMVTPPRWLMRYPTLLHPEPWPLWQSTADLYPHKRYSNTVLSQSLWSLWVLVCTRYIWLLWVSLASMGFDSKHDFTPPTVFLGLLLCPWMWVVSSKSLQCHTALLQRLLSCWGFSALGRRVSPHSHSSLTAATPPPTVFLGFCALGRGIFCRWKN